MALSIGCLKVACLGHRLGLSLLGEEVFEVAELTLQNLVLGAQGCHIQLQLVVFFDYSVL